MKRNEKEEEETISRVTTKFFSKRKILFHTCLIHKQSPVVSDYIIIQYTYIYYRAQNEIKEKKRTYMMPCIYLTGRIGQRQHQQIEKLNGVIHICMYLCVWYERQEGKSRCAIDFFIDEYRKKKYFSLSINLLQLFFIRYISLPHFIYNSLFFSVFSISFH